MRVIGTAGHVDHGKSTLIRALTGIDPDRLQEEKERGMTIDLGFAWLTLPNGVDVSIVDVPGHERFVHNMLAGVGGIDIALLVVAADEGIMPQTREHLAILDLLGIADGVVALTKRDLVDDEWLDLVQADVEECLTGTSLAGASIIPCSATTGAGLDRLVEELQRLLQHERKRPSSGRPRLPIDRVFTVAGFGTVVTGTLIDGELRLGQELEVQPGGLRTRVRGLQSHKRKAELVPAGTRTAVNLGGLAVDELRRGDVVAAPGTLNATRSVDARLRLIKDARPLKHHAELSFHSGAAETPARLALLDRDELAPGDEAWVQLRLQDPVALARGDPFVVRLPSPSQTVGGGTIVEPHAQRHRRRQAAVLEQLAILARGSPEDIVAQALRTREPTDLGELSRRSGLPAETVRAAVGGLVESRAVLVLDGATATATVTAPSRLETRTLVVSTEGWAHITRTVEAILGGHHRAYPLRRGLAKEEVRTRLGAEPRVFVRLLERLVAQGTVAEDGPLVRLSGHAVRLSPGEERQVAALVALLRSAGVAPPERGEWEAQLRISPELTDALLSQRRLVEVAPGLVYEPDTLAALVEQVSAAIRDGGPRTVAQIRDRLDASRKYVLALVSYMDERKITRRVGDERTLF